VSDQPQVQVTRRSNASLLVASSGRNLVARALRDVALLGTRCNRCGEHKELVFAGRICADCSDALDTRWATCTSTDWVLVATRSVPIIADIMEALKRSLAKARGETIPDESPSPAPRTESKQWRYIFQDTSYAAMKVRWASQEQEDDDERSLGSASDEEIAIAESLGVSVPFIRPATTKEIADHYNDVGFMHYERQDYAGAVKWFRRAAEHGSILAQHDLGFMYAEGEGVQQNFAEAAKWYRIAADQGDASAQANLGWLYEQGYGIPQDYTEAATWYRRAADGGNRTCQYNLGIGYHTGKGVPQDYAEAVRWYRKAAEQGHPPAQFNLACMYGNGYGVPEDHFQAATWFRKAADQGNRDAQYNLGVAYSSGDGVPRDYVRAHMWANLAASTATGHDQETYSSTRDQIAAMMTPQQIAEAQRLAREWRPSW